MSGLRRPCTDCPWRVDAPRHYWHPDHFKKIWTTCQDDGAHIMNCHKARSGQEIPCQGWVRVMGVEAIGVRILLLRGVINENEIADRRCVPLFVSFRDMLIANGVQPPERNQIRSTQG